MKRLSVLVLASTVALAIAAPAIRADVKTSEKTVMKFGGVLGSMSRMLGKAASDEGITTSVAVKGQRKLSVNDTTGEIIDLTEQKVYRLDLKKKEYKVLTFDQVRQEWKDMQDDVEKNAKKMQEAQGANPDPNASAALEFSASVKETGQHKTIAGYDTREVVMTITGVHAGKTLEEGGGSVTTSTMWIAPKIAAIEEIHEFDKRYYKAILGDDAAAQAVQQLTALFAMFGSAKPMMDKLQAEGSKLAGTPLVTTTVMETVKSAEQMKAASGDGQQNSGNNSGGSGIGGMLARRMAGNKAAQVENAPRTTMFTNVRELLTVATSASADDVAVPAGFKEKK